MRFEVVGDEDGAGGSDDEVLNGGAEGEVVAEADLEALDERGGTQSPDERGEHYDDGVNVFECVSALFEGIGRGCVRWSCSNHRMQRNCSSFITIRR